jgi:hypothetical protein
MKVFSSKKRIALSGIAAIAAAAMGVGAFAYFTSTGSGSGNGTSGTSQAVTVAQDSITYNGPSGPTPYASMAPGDTATVAFGITNPGGNEYVNQITLASWTSSNASVCASTVGSESSWFTMPAVSVGTDFPHGTDMTTGKTGTITFNDVNAIQNACAGLTITFNYSSN